MTANEMQTIKEYKVKLATDHRWAIRAIEVLYQHQTPSEQAGMHTDELNGVGFSKFDSEILSSFARQLLAHRCLSNAQLAVAYKRLPKYAYQLYRIAQAKLAEAA